MASRHKQAYLTESQIREYFMNDIGSKIVDNEDSDLNFEPEHSIS